MVNQQIRRLWSNQQVKVHVSTHDVIVIVYRDLENTPGPSVRTRARAARAGWLPPVMWDDPDDPEDRGYWAYDVKAEDDTPDENVLDALLIGRVKWRDTSKVDRNWVAWELTKTMPIAEIARRVGCGPDAVRDARDAHAAGLKPADDEQAA